MEKCIGFGKGGVEFYTLKYRSELWIECCFQKWHETKFKCRCDCAGYIHGKAMIYAHSREVNKF